MNWPDTVTVKNPSATVTDAEGDSTVAYATHGPYEGWLQQTESVEVQTGRQVVTSQHLLFIRDPQAPVTESSLAVVDGDTFEVAGRPDRVKTPRGVHHLEVRLRVVSS